MPPHRMHSSREASPRSRYNIGGIREGIQHLFTGRSSIGPRNDSSQAAKFHRPTHELQHRSSRRLGITHHAAQSRGRRPPGSAPVPIDTRPSFRRSDPEWITQRPTDLGLAQDSRQRPSRSRVGVDPSEHALAGLVWRGGRRRDRRHGQRACVPKIKNRRIRSKARNCMLSGVILFVILTIYLSLTLTTHSQSQEFHVLLILVILVLTIYFCHSLIRLCMMLTHPPSNINQLRSSPEMSDIRAYAIPPSPVPVRLVRDEEAVGIRSETFMFPPPAYGLWRESVVSIAKALECLFLSLDTYLRKQRVDPNRIFWQRKEGVPSRRSSGNKQSQMANRPPSYVSEDGVGYVLDAGRRSIAPVEDVALPSYPAERSRSGRN